MRDYEVVVILLKAAICAFGTQYAVNEWLIYMGKPPSFAWWYGLTLGLLPYWATSAVLIAVIATFIAKFFW